MGYVKRGSGRNIHGHKMEVETLHIRMEEKDLEVTVTDNRSPDKHINKIMGKALNLLKNVRTAFIYSSTLRYE